MLWFISKGLQSAVTAYCICRIMSPTVENFMFCLPQCTARLGVLYSMGLMTTRRISTAASRHGSYGCATLPGGDDHLWDLHCHLFSWKFCRKCVKLSRLGWQCVHRQPAIQLWGFALCCGGQAATLMITLRYRPSSCCFEQVLRVV